MKRLLLPVLFVLGAAAGAAGQQVVEPIRPHELGVAPVAPHTGAAGGPDTRARDGAAPPVRDLTPALNDRPAARRALRALHRTRGPAAKVTPAGPRRSCGGDRPPEYDVGDRRSFRVYHVENEEWEAGVSFELRRRSPRFYLWVEVGEIENGHVRDRDADSLYTALEERTPAGSYDPERGIVRNDEELFGCPSDVDENDRVHVLLTDIHDGRSQGENEPFVAGFFYGADLDTSEDAEGNSAEVIYLDTQPGIYTDEGVHRVTEDVQATAAQEYQHLIHANYDPDELTFVNEGLAEWAEIANGYAPRPARYLSSPSDSTGYNVRLFSWRAENRDRVLYDYQRAGLWTHYLAEQMGALAAGSIARRPENGMGGYAPVLAEHDPEGRDPAAVLADFHTANAINDRSVREAFGYESPDRAQVRAVPAFAYDGRIDAQSLPQAPRVRAGAVQILQWQHVHDLRIRLDAVETSARDGFVLRAFLWPEGESSPTVRTLRPRDAAHTFEGQLDRVLVVAAHVDPGGSGAKLAFSAEWDREDPRFRPRTVAYDDGSPAGPSGDPYLFSMNAEEDGVLATRFVVPDGEQAVLSRVSLVFYYRNQFRNGPPRDAPRDFRLHVWADDGAGRPGREIFARTYEDPRPYTMGVPARSFDRFSLDLSAYEDELDDLPEAIYVGVSEAGTDENYLVATVAPYATRNTSFLWASGGGWQSVWETTLSDGTSLKGTTLPFRTEFLVPVRPPQALETAPNFPNPFRTSTNIRFSLPEDQPVTLRVYDALGRYLRTELDASLRAGPHTITLSAENWPSGLYLYVLETPDRRVSGKMTVMR